MNICANIRRVSLGLAAFAALTIGSGDRFVAAGDARLHAQALTLVTDA